MGIISLRRLKDIFFPRTTLPTQKEISKLSQSSVMIESDLVSNEITRSIQKWISLNKSKSFTTDKQLIQIIGRLKGFILLNTRKFISTSTPHIKDIGIYITENTASSGVLKNFNICVTIYTKDQYDSTIVKNFLILEDGNCKLL